MKDVYLTKEGIAKLKEELDRLINVDRKEVIKKIKETREYGDLSENAEYDAARTQQSMIEGRIEELEAMLKKARLISHPAKSNGKVTIGDTVEVESEGSTVEFTLVGSAESDPSKGLISVESPLGSALLGSKVGDTVKVAIPDGGTAEYKIIRIK
ncbi:transcription elongation factor GreA [Patescibacteria group bacterium]|nr:transcription elongation factor GreA [Patescibacteria group bacterium]